MCAQFEPAGDREKRRSSCRGLSAKPPVDGNVRGDRGEMVFRVGTLISGLQLLVHGSDSLRGGGGLSKLVLCDIPTNPIG